MHKKDNVDVTVIGLIYRSKKWLDFLLDQLSIAKNNCSYKTLIVANDPYLEIRTDHRVGYVHDNPDTSVHYIKRVYSAWNRSVEVADTRYVVLVNSDMAFADGWLDALVRYGGTNILPTSLLVESGRIPSAMPEYVKDCGVTPDTFDRRKFVDFASEIRCRAIERGRLFMPVLFERERFLAMGGYPDGNIYHPDGRVESGDAFFFDRLVASGMEWVTVMDSICYHVQQGEQDLS